MKNNIYENEIQRLAGYVKNKSERADEQSRRRLVASIIAAAAVLLLLTLAAFVYIKII